MRKLIVVLLVALLYSLNAGASYFVPIALPDEESDLSGIDVDHQGNFAYVISRYEGEDELGEDAYSGTLYLNGNPYAVFGPNEKFTHLAQFVVAGNKVVFSARTAREQVGEDSCGTYLGYFNGPVDNLCPPHVPPTLVRKGFDLDTDVPFAANASGDFMVTTEAQQVNWRVYSPSGGFFRSPTLWVMPTWATELSPAPTGSVAYRLLSNGKFAFFDGECLQIYARGPLIEPQSGQPYQGLLQRESENCLASLPAGDVVGNAVINAESGDMAFCAGPSGGGAQSVYFASSAGAAEVKVADVSACDAVGTDSAGNVAYSSGSQVFWSSDPDTPVLATGHIFDGKELSGINAIAVTSGGTIVARANLRNLPESSGFSESEFGLFFAEGDTEFPPGPDEPEPDVVVWNTDAGGRFFNPENWNPQTVPDSEQVAVLSPDAIAYIDFEDSLALTQRLLVERGVIVFEGGGGYQFSSGTVMTPSFLVEPSSAFSGAAATIADGHQFQTFNATVRDPYFTEFVQVGLLGNPEAAGSQTRWMNTGRLTVDAFFDIAQSAEFMSDALVIASATQLSGTVTVSQCSVNSSVNFGDTVIGKAGVGKLIFEQDCILEAVGNRILGELPGSHGIVEINGGSWIRFYSGIGEPAGDLTVGKSGQGDLTIIDGSVGAGSVIIGQNADSAGTVTIEADQSPVSVLDADTVKVGVGGGAGLFLGSGAQVQAKELQVGVAPGSNGFVVVSGAPPKGFGANLAIELTVNVGLEGNGDLTLSDGATLTSQFGSIGTGSEDRGKVQLRTGGQWSLEFDLFIGSASTGEDPEQCDGDEVSLGVGILDGDETARVTGNQLNVDGPASTVKGNATLEFENSHFTNCATLSPGSSPGALTFSGNLEITGGILKIELSGLEEGAYDVVNVLGDTQFNGGTVNFVFEGFIPKQGDQIRFLRTQGELTTGDSIEFTYQGANEGFEFSVEADDEGNLIFTASNDAVDQLFGSSFESD